MQWSPLPTARVSQSIDGEGSWASQICFAPWAMQGPNGQHRGAMGGQRGRKIESATLAFPGARGLYMKVLFDNCATSRMPGGRRPRMPVQLHRQSMRPIWLEAGPGIDKYLEVLGRDIPEWSFRLGSCAACCCCLMTTCVSTFSRIVLLMQGAPCRTPSGLGALTCDLPLRVWPLV